MLDAIAPLAIRGAVGEKVLRKAPDLFPNDLRTAVFELLQNSRRAGATEVRITLLKGDPNGTLQIRDDGCGISDFSRLVTFGSSGWNAHTDVIENAAGMGVYSIAKRGCTVRSGGRRVTLTQAVFIGSDEAMVVRDLDHILGTEISFPVTAAEMAHDGVGKIVADAARWYPIPVIFNGVPAMREEFLAKHDHVVEWNGVRIGVGAPRSARPSNPFTWRSQDTGTYINFHGHVVEMPEKLRIGEVFGRAWDVWIDVVEAPDLGLVLPARHTPIQNDFYRALVARAKLAIFEHIRTLPGHTLPFRTAQEGRAMGVALPDADLRLKAWHPVSESERENFFEDRSEAKLSQDKPVVIVELDELDAANFSIYCSAADEQSLILARAEHSFEGYTKYDRLPRVVSVAIQGRLGEKHAVYLPSEGEWDAFSAAFSNAPDAPIGDVLLDELTLQVALKSPPKRPGGRPIVKWTAHRAVPLAFLSGDNDISCIVIAAAKGASPQTVANWMEDCFFAASDDHECDSADTQKRAFAADALAVARRLLMTSAMASLEEAVDVIGRSDFNFRSGDFSSMAVAIEEGEDSRFPKIVITAIAKDGTRLTRTL